MILLGIGYLVLTLAVLKTGSSEADITVKANLLFIVITYMFHTIGELFLSPIGLSMVSAIAPVKLASLLMGVWLAGSGMANWLAGKLASFTQSLGYLEVFASIGIIVIVLGLVLLLFSKSCEYDGIIQKTDASKIRSVFSITSPLTPSRSRGRFLQD